MKKIAITQRLIENVSYFEIRDALDIRWGKLFSNLGYLPILLPTDYNFKQYFEAFDINGIILSGGNDLSSILPDELSKKRDAFEKELIKYAIKIDIPVLGICRGMLVIAEYFNGEFKKVDGHVGINHNILISDKSKFNHDLKNIGDVNSYHNYSVEKISNDFIISAKSEDGVIEAIEHKKYKIFGQMWHSERQDPFNENELNIIKKLFV